MSDLPFTVQLRMAQIVPKTYDNHIRRTLTSLRGQFLDTDAYNERLAQGDELLYEVYEFKRPEVAGELLSGISIVHPGKVGEEFFMTKGHFHTVLDTAEVYFCLNGRGVMVMETPEGDWSVADLTPGAVLYVPPRWAHRSVNTSPDEDLITLFVYPGNAGHDYGTIETQGFRKLMIDRGNGPEIVDNPRWQAPEKR